MTTSAATAPDFSAVTGNTLYTVVGALLTIVLIAAVASLITAATLWVYGEHTGNYHAASRGKTGVLVALGAATAAGAGVAWMNFLLDLGGTL
jgi:hypothetical protein